jgi:hypothetical protein
MWTSLNPAPPSYHRLIYVNIPVADSYPSLGYNLYIYPCLTCEVNRGYLSNTQVSLWVYIWWLYTLGLGFNKLSTVCLGLGFVFQFASPSLWFVKSCVPSPSTSAFATWHFWTLRGGCYVILLIAKGLAIINVSMNFLAVKSKSYRASSW